MGFVLYEEHIVTPEEIADIKRVEYNRGFEDGRQAGISTVASALVRHMVRNGPRPDRTIDREHFDKFDPAYRWMQDTWPDVVPQDETDVG